MEMLDHPIWHALSTTHARFAQGNELAKRYPADISPLAAIREQSPQAYSALAESLDKEEVAVFFLDVQPQLPEGWRLTANFEMHQMMCVDPSALLPCAEHIEALSTDDVPEMKKLAEATEPGPFRDRTIEFGGYRGIRDGAQLAAMAGQRISMSGYTEVSAVCTYLQYRGRGYAPALVSAVSRGIFERGETPILGVRIDNAAAIRAYQKVGFAVRRNLRVVVLKRPL